MKKVTLALLGTALIALSFVGQADAVSWIGITKTPSIEIKVVDATTGRPIENVMANVAWHEQYLGLSPDSLFRSYKSETVVSDKMGILRVSSSSKLHLGSYFIGIDVDIYHPLNDGRHLQGLDIGKPDKDGIVRHEVKLTSLEQKYTVDIERLKTIEEKRDFADGFYRTLRSKESGYYWIILRNRGIRYDLNADFQKWDDIISILSKYLIAPKTVQEVKESIRKNLEKAKEQ